MNTEDLYFETTDEFYGLVKSINRIHQKLDDLSSEVKKLAKSENQPLEKYVTESQACTLLKLSKYTIAKMRRNKEICFISQHRKILYPVDALYKYLENCKR